jgi:hypothetical protein
MLAKIPMPETGFLFKPSEGFVALKEILLCTMPSSGGLSAKDGLVREHCIYQLCGTNFLPFGPPRWNNPRQE